MKLQRKRTRLLLSVLLSFAIETSYADEALIKQNLSQSMPGLTIDHINPSKISGLYEVTVGSNIIYVSEDGHYLIQGHLIDVKNKKDLTEDKLALTRRLALDKIGEDQMIIFRPKKSLHTVSIFTDIDCGYCRKLHSELDQYLAQGITIRYLFYPRAGKGSESYNKAVSVWCADDRNAALTQAKKGNIPPSKTCPNPVDKQMQLGEDFGVRGTPMIVTEKGNIFPGYVPAKQLAKALENE